MMQKHFVIADIHGCFETFRYLLEEILQPGRDDEICLLGDYINKGPSSKKTLDYLISLKERWTNLTTLMGNHEKYLIDALSDPGSFHLFIEKGGAQTLKDFDVDSVRSIPERYISFIRSLDDFKKTDSFLLVHAGLNFGLVDPFQDKNAMLNIRNMEPIPTVFPMKIVHGHVPIPLKRILEQGDENRNIFLDGGCVYPQRKGMGFLVALELNSWKYYVKECIDDVANCRANGGQLMQ